MPAKSKDGDKRSGNVRKIGETGSYTYFLTLPKSDLRALGWRKGQKVTIKRVGKKLILEDWKG